MQQAIRGRRARSARITTVTRLKLFYGLMVAWLLAIGLPGSLKAEDQLVLGQDDRIALIGNTLADRMQHDGWLETLFQAAFPEHRLTFRNLAFPGDELKRRPRSANFGSADQWLTKVEADIVFAFFGYNEAFAGPEGVAGFERDLVDVIQGMKSRRYNGQSAPQLVFFSPIAHEDLECRYLPDGTKNNRNLSLYTRSMKKICDEQDVLFVNLFERTRELYDRTDQPMTMNGVHLLERGNRAIAEYTVQQLTGKDPGKSQEESALQRLRQAVLDKNLHWFSRYRVVDGYNVYGGRSKLSWHGQSNYDVMQREMQIFDVMTANRDKRVWAVARGGDLEVRDDNLPPLLDVKTSLPGELEGGKHRYPDPVKAIDKMTVADGMEVNLFASEKMFPELVNPVQMAVDTDGRLFVSVWPSYPHWNPTKPREDKIICLPDEDRDGVADRCIVFADGLNSITGFEFWGGGMLVAAPPEIWFLKDTDGDDKADYRLRMLQGVSSADTHHTANAMVIGPDGGLYWSRGVFHVTNMETPTKTFRSTKSGVYRFDPRTFEVSFHFPIGPNPHGDFFDQWGFQFANDGTSGTGSYVNIGKGIGNKQWFKKRVRPVAATGMLSSSHFPEANNGNFLICNTIGFLGVLQYEVKYDGADIYAEEIEPILYSTDPTFRPSDLEIAGDGALYVSDWSNALIGHMQHNIRDPNRDHSHGRIYRVTAKDRPLLKPVKLKGKPIPEVLQAFFAKENGVRYRARLELSGRDTSDVVRHAKKFAAKLTPSVADEAQALLETVWTFQEHRVVDRQLLAKVYQAAEPRARAAAIRTLGQWGPQVDDWQPLLMAAAQDDEPIVRAEAVKAAVAFTGLEAAEVIFQVANQPTDLELERVIDYASDQINVSRLVDAALTAPDAMSPAARAYLLKNADPDELLRLDPSRDVYEAVLDRSDVGRELLEQAIEGLATLAERPSLEVLIDEIDSRAEQGRQLHQLGELLTNRPRSDLLAVRGALIRLAKHGNEISPHAFAAWMRVDRDVEAALQVALQDRHMLRHFLNAAPWLADASLNNQLYAAIRPIAAELPDHLRADTVDNSSAFQASGVQVDYFAPNPKDASLETFNEHQPNESGLAEEITIDVPQLGRRDQFGLRFSGQITIERPGRYRFFLASDDGSRLYFGDQLLINNDGLHGVVEKSAEIKLSSGSHPFTLTYFDNGGGDALRLSWSGPGFGKQKVPADRLSVGGGETLQDEAIRTLVSLPRHTRDKAKLLTRLILADTARDTAVEAMLELPVEAVAETDAGYLAESLAAHVADIPARYRTSRSALATMRLIDRLANRLDEDVASELRARLADLEVTVIEIGTVPHRMIYDKERLAVQTGKPIEIVFSNTDNMPHNFAIVQPGTLEAVGTLAEATAQQTDAIKRHYIPETEDVMVHSRLLQPGQQQAIRFTAPPEPGIYPYVCTYPGHWRRMYGALYVVQDVKAYLADPASYVAAHDLKVQDELLKFSGRDTEWTYDDLADAAKSLMYASKMKGHEGSASDAASHGGVAPSFEVGKNLFKVANCVACHRLNDEGYEFGPNLAKLAPERRTPQYILRSLIEPGRDIDEKYQAYAFEMASGQLFTGMILEESDEEVQVIVDPIAKAVPTVLKASEIDARTRLSTSPMPKGLLNRLLRQEIVDLVAYVLSGGDREHPVFAGHDH